LQQPLATLRQAPPTAGAASIIDDDNNNNNKMMLNLSEWSQKAQLLLEHSDPYRSYRSSSHRLVAVDVSRKKKTFGLPPILLFSAPYDIFSDFQERVTIVF
jgi:hypothetical protein